MIGEDTDAGAALGPDRGTTRGEVASRLAFVAAALNRRLRPAGAGVGLTHVELSALATVARAGAVRPGDVARLEGIAAPGATRILAELERRGLIRREPDPVDGRSTLVGTTAAGDAAILDARRARAEGVQRLLDDLDDQDLAAITQAVGALEAALQGDRSRSAELVAR